jgi:hypothetical protein
MSKSPGLGLGIHTTQAELGIEALKVVIGMALSATQSNVVSSARHEAGETSGGSGEVFLRRACCLKGSSNETRRGRGHVGTEGTRI